jgi:hypothetical protein
MQNSQFVSVAAFSPASTFKPVDAVLFRGGPFEPAVGEHQPWGVRVELERLDDVLGLASREPRELPSGEEVSEFHPQSGVALRDTIYACLP